MEQHSKRKDVIKNVAIIFLIIMLILTFCSDTINNYSLPEVATQCIEPGSITNKVRISGSVEAAEPYSVIFKDSRKVTEVKAKVGDEVKKGDVLYLLEEGESENLKEAEKEYERAKSEYDTLVVSKGYSTDVTEALEEGEKKDRTEYQKTASSLNNSVKSSKESLDKCEAELEKIRDLQDRWEGTDSAKGIDEKQTLIDQYNQYENSIENARDSKAAYDDLLSDDDYKEAYMSYEAAVAQEAEAKAEMESAEAAFEKASIAYEKNANKDTKEAKMAARTVKNNSREAYSKAVQAREKAEKSDKYAAYVNAVNQSDSLAQQIKSLQNSLAQVNAVFENKREELEKQYYVAEAKVEAAKKAYEDASDKQSEFQSDYTDSSELVQSYDAMIAAKKEYDKIVEECSTTTITSPVEGTVLSLAVTAGETIENGATVATVQLKGKGFTLSGTITNEQAKFVTIGDEGEISNSYWYPDVHAKVASIKADPTNPRAGKIVKFALDGTDLVDEQNLTITVGSRTSNYDYIVPKSAVREDVDSTYVLQIKIKSTPLGDRYIAEQIPVKVLAEDDTQCAVSGALEPYGYVITTSSKPIQPGDLVRFKD